ncbi:MAG: hypothetical protein GF334_10830 [Candidatus Altiarchaeales archaeon]|nr:hypothetical protein [Candidatus Altiarchaeales archaeon]
MVSEKDSTEISIRLPESFKRFGNPQTILGFTALLLTVIRLNLQGTFVYSLSPFVLGLLGVASFGVFLFLYEGKRDVGGLGVTVLILLTALFSWYSVDYGGSSLARDFTVFSLASASFLLGYLFYYTQTVRTREAIVFSIFLASLLIHVAPAHRETGLPDQLAALDPYWHYKWMQRIYEEGQLPEHDASVYPFVGGLLKHNDSSYVQRKMPLGYGTQQDRAPLLSNLFYSSTALILKPLGVELLDIAILGPGVIAALTIVLVYLLVVELFADMKPYNMVVGVTAAFCLMLSPAFASKAVATNAEDDALGMFLSVGAAFLFFAGLHRKKIIYAALAGFALLMLKLTWGGWTYLALVLGIFGFLYGLIAFINRRDCIAHLPYLFVVWGIGEMSFLFLHARDSLPTYVPPPLLVLFPMLSGFVLSILLEFTRIRVWGMNLEVEGASLETGLRRLMQKNLTIIASLILIAGLVFIVHEGPVKLINYAASTLMGVSDRSVVHDTVSEQTPLADNFSAFISAGYSRYGGVFLYGFLLIPLLLYLAVARYNNGALFVLAWSVPMLWGVYNKSAWIFGSSVAVTILGSCVGLFVAKNRKQLADWRIVGTIFLLLLPFSYIPFLGATSYNSRTPFVSAVGYSPFYSGPTRDHFFWWPALQWLKSGTKPSSAVLTWWDYGHWITSISHRPVLIDNLQFDEYQIQDVARFFVNKTSEQEAFEIVSAYDTAYEIQGRDLKYVVVDWTMIPKGSALHYISLGDIESNTKPDPMVGFRNYAHCNFNPGMSSLEPRIQAEADGSFKRVRDAVFLCQGYVGGVVFSVSGDPPNLVVEEIQVLMPTYTVPWSQWSQSQDASILGVSSLDDVLACSFFKNQDPNINALCSSTPALNTLVYVPGEFQDYMMTKLYLTNHLEGYERHGLVNREYKPLKHFRLVEDFSRGYVRAYEIDYDGVTVDERNASLAPKFFQARFN